MLYDARLSPQECELLASLVGQSLVSVETDGWSAELSVSSTLVSVLPKEITTPDAEHPCGDVDRPLIQLVTRRRPFSKVEARYEELGTIEAVNVLSVLAGFSAVEDCPAVEFGPGFALPAGPGYGYVYYPPDRRGQVQQEVGAAALIDWDRAIEIVTDRCHGVLVYTSLHFVLVNVGGLPEADWAQPGLLRRRGVMRVRNIHLS